VIPVEDEVKELRRQSADARVALRAAEAELADARSRRARTLQREQSNVSTAHRRATSSERRVAQYKAAISAGLDIAFADRLQGDTDDELLDDAKRLRGATK
jgi:hypothetical protein